jgi:hypothetical protein
VDRLAEAIALAILSVCILIGVRMLEKAFKQLRGGSDEHEDEAA